MSTLPTVFYQPGITAAALQISTINALVASRTADESHIVSTAFVVNNLVNARITDEANIATLSNNATLQQAAINSLFASRTADEATIAAVQTAVAAIPVSVSSDATFNSFWCNAFGGVSSNADGSVNQTAGSLPASMRVYKTDCRVTLVLSSCFGSPTQHTATAIFAQRIPSWACPSTMMTCAIVLYSDGSVPGQLTITPNGTVSIHILYGSWGSSAGIASTWGNNAGIATATCVDYII